MKKRMKAGFVAPLLMVLVAVALLTLGACDNKAATDATSNKTNNEAINDTISKETMEANMKEVQAYLKECGAFFIATVDGDQPRVRPFGVSEIIVHN